LGTAEEKCFWSKHHLGLTPLAAPPLKNVHHLPLQRRISSAALQPLHLVLMLKVHIGQGAWRTLPQTMEVEAVVRADDQVVQFKRLWLLVLQCGLR
jgi:hypothetical protein